MQIVKQASFYSATLSCCFFGYNSANSVNIREIQFSFSFSPNPQPGSRCFSYLLVFAPRSIM